MFATLTLAASVSGNSGLRILLFVLLFVAILLIIVGAVIALITLYTYLKTRTAKTDTLPAE
jgi:hypothetical protein